MRSAPRELLKEYIRSQRSTSTSEIMHTVKEMFLDVIRQAMEMEMDEDLGRERCHRSKAPEGESRNYRNGYSKKTVKTRLGEAEIQAPRDRMGAYEPKIMPEVTVWQNRSLEEVHPFVFMDAIHYKAKEDHRYITKAAYVVLDITVGGRKDILDVWIREYKSSKFWLNVLNDLKSRGVKDAYLFCTDGLRGMMQTIQVVFPQSRLEVFLEKWRKQYPSCVKSWEENCDLVLSQLQTMFADWAA